MSRRPPSTVQVFQVGPMRVRVPEHGQPVEMTMYLSPEKALEQISALHDCLKKTVRDKVKANGSNNDVVKKLAKQQIEKVEAALALKAKRAAERAAREAAKEKDAGEGTSETDPLSLHDVARVEAVENDPRMASWPPEWQLPPSELQVKLDSMVMQGLGISIYYGKVAHGPQNRRPYGFRVTRKHNKFRRQGDAQLFSFTKYGGPEGARDAALAHIAKDEAEEARMAAASPSAKEPPSSPRLLPKQQVINAPDGSQGIVTRGRRRQWVAERSKRSPEATDSEEEAKRARKSEEPLLELEDIQEMEDLQEEHESPDLDGNPSP